MYITLRLGEQTWKERGKLDLEVSLTAGASDTVLRRLFVTDHSSRDQFLVDTGADVSVIPKSPKEKYNKSNLVLCAANGTPISTYGQKLLQLDFGLRRAFRWSFLIADVSKPILGTDFLSHFNLLVDLRHKRLIDGNTRLNVSGYLGNISVVQVPHLKIDTLYSDLLNEYPEITRSSITPLRWKHNIEHAIITKGQPVTAKARRLAPEKLKATKLEFEFMLEQGLYLLKAIGQAHYIWSRKRTETGDHAAIIVSSMIPQYLIVTRSLSYKTAYNSCTVQPFFQRLTSYVRTNKSQLERRTYQKRRSLFLDSLSSHDFRFAKRRANVSKIHRWGDSRTRLCCYAYLISS